MSDAASSIFARIAAGEIPCHKVFENDLVLAFLDINPLAEGHTLLIPKRPVARFEDLTPQERAEMGQRLGELAPRIIRVVGAAGYNLLLNTGKVAAQDVPYVHFHIIPRKAGDGLGYRWQPQQRSPQELAALAQRIAKAT